jgi:hypothetical protein
MTAPHHHIIWKSRSRARWLGSGFVHNFGSAFIACSATDATTATMPGILPIEHRRGRAGTTAWPLRSKTLHQNDGARQVADDSWRDPYAVRHPRRPRGLLDQRDTHEGRRGESSPVPAADRGARAHPRRRGGAWGLVPLMLQLLQRTGHPKKFGSVSNQERQPST